MGGSDPGGGDGLEGFPEDEGAGGSKSGKKKVPALLEPSIDALAASGLGSKSATMAIGERLLRVELHLDIIRGLIRHADGREAVEEEGGF